jgi:anti-sigma B factor antagonist
MSPSDRIQAMGVPEHLNIQVTREADRVIVALDGELDMANAPLLQSTIEDQDLTIKTVVLDLQQLRFLDSTGLRVILAARERCRENEQQFAITRGSEQVQRLLSVTGVAAHLRMLATPDELVV